MTDLHYTSDDRMVEIFGSPNYKPYDGIHLRGKLGSLLYNKCLISAIKTAGIEMPSKSRNRSFRKVQEQEQGKEAIPTSNKFEWLN